MPPKTFAAKTSSATVGTRKNERKRDTKIEEPTPGPSGPIIRATITKAPPASHGLSFLDAVSATKRAAADSSAAPKSAVPLTAGVPAAESSSATLRKSTPRASEPVEDSVEDVPAVTQEEVVAVPAEQPGAGKQYNWAEDEYTDIQPSEPQPEPEVKESPVVQEEPKPEFCVEYPEGVLNNRAVIGFKAPLGDHMTLASAVEKLRTDRYTFQLLMESQKKELEQKESELAAQEQLLRRDREVFAAENAKLIQQQAQFAQQQQQQQVIPSQPPQQAPLMNTAAMHHMGAMPPSQPRYNTMGGYHGQDGWDPSSYDMYNSFPRPNYRMNRGGIRPNTHGYYQPMGYPQNRHAPVAPGNFPPAVGRAPNRPWPAQ